MSNDRDGMPEESSAAFLRELIRDIGIPPRPAILEHLAAEMRKFDPDLVHMAHLIERDVGLAAGLVKSANSPY
jgi:HD-like signal output (HDOD) protein